MAKYKPKDLKVKTNDELKEQIRLLRKEQLIYASKYLMVRMKTQPGLSKLEKRLLA